MDLELLRTFLELSKTRHFGKTADNLYITQSAVSARIKTLESTLNTRLFDRSNKLLALSDDGERFVSHAETILLAWNNAKLELQSDVEHQASLSIGSTSGLWHYVFNEQIGQCLTDHKLFLNTRSHAQDELNQLLMSGALDLILAYDMISGEQFSCEELGALELNLLCAEPLNAGETPHNYIHLDWGSNFNLFISRHFNERLTPCMHTDNAQTAQAQLASLNACAYLPQILVHQQALNVCPSNKLFKRKIYACYSQHSSKRKVIKDCIELLKF